MVLALDDEKDGNTVVSSLDEQSGVGVCDASKNIKISMRFDLMHQIND